MSVGHAVMPATLPSPGEGGLLLRPLLPASVRLAEMAPAQAEPAQLHPAERAQIAHAVERRQREYAAGRLLAHSLLREMGAADAPLLNGEDRVPRWPAGIAGSITHCPGLCAVAVTAAVAAIGIDVEPADPLPPGIAARVLDEGERRALPHLPPALQACADRLVFSAKEAVYKALFPRTRTFLDFHDVQIVLRADGHFTGVARPLAALGPLQGRYRLANGFLATAVVWPAV